MSGRLRRLGGGASVAVVVAIAAAWMTAGTASAATYCVDLAGGGCDFAYTGSAGLGTALANAGQTQANDVIRIATGTYAGPFTYTVG